MKEAEFEGRSVEEALLKASSELGVNIAEMTYEVLQSDSGLFGLFGGTVKVRVRVADDAAQLAFRKEYVPGPGDTGLAQGMIAADEARARAEVEPAPAAPEDDPEKASRALEVLRGLLANLDVQAEVTLNETQDQILLNIRTDEHDTVIGRDGEVLAALQFLVNKIVNRFPEGRKLVVLDAEGFRDRREEALGALARRMGEKALSTGRVVRLSPMSPQDRRLVHMALRDHPGLTTRSDGEGNYRCLLIVPNSFAAAGPGERKGR
ncbi:MAG TPA: RNA-binding cell elongation regulator Jag/EloR [Myxococcota bacterium]|jgi:spoIIIJ-associated protein|nr:RNA-binding cell elongation regulator Jag/EloR [Myxococcota bacterium]